MQLNRRVIIASAGVAAALTVGGAGIAQAVGDGSEEQDAGQAAAKARGAALKAAGGGTVLEIERQDGDGAGTFEVEVRRQDGSQVEVHLDDRYQPVGTAADNDSESEPEDEAGEDENSRK